MADFWTIDVQTEISVRDKAKRELDIRIVPWDVEISTKDGSESFTRGAFDETDPTRVMLMEPEHEAHIGLGQDGKPTLIRRPAGRGMALEQRDDAAYLTTKVARTAAGDDILALAEDGVVTGASMEFMEVPGGTARERKRGRQHRTHNRVLLTGVSPTYRPAYADAGIVAVRTETEEDVADQEAVETTTEAAPAKVEARAYEDALGRMDAGFAAMADKWTERLAEVGEQARAAFSIPTGTDPADAPDKGEWLSIALKLLSGDRIPDSQYRAVQDLITTDNAGIVPDTYSSEIIGVIDARRPFMSSTRRLATPATGLNLIVPKIVQRPIVGLQDPEKEVLASQKTIITTESFGMVSKGGVGDLSLQLLKRSDPSFLGLYLELLAEAYAQEAEDEAVQALFDATGGVGAGNALDPENLSLGSSFQNSFDAIRRPPDTIWLSTEAIGGFIDAKASTTNAPLYPGLTPSATAAGGISGTISGLRAVHVPALDAHGSYAIVGPSSGFAWAEDGTYTLQVDVPSKAGRDVALVGMLWFCPWYPDAFSLYNVAS